MTPAPDPIGNRRETVSETFRVTVWRDVRVNWSREYPATEEGFGRAHKRARQLVERYGGSVAQFDTQWPDAGSYTPTALVVGRDPVVTLSVQYQDRTIVHPDG